MCAAAGTEALQDLLWHCGAGTSIVSQKLMTSQSWTALVCENQAMKKIARIFTKHRKNWAEEKQGNGGSPR